MQQELRVMKRACPESYTGRSRRDAANSRDKEQNQEENTNSLSPYPTSASWIKPQETSPQGAVRQLARLSPMASKQAKNGFWLEESKRKTSTHIILFKEKQKATKMDLKILST